MEEINEVELEGIAEQIKEGYTSGLINSTDEGYRVVWSIEINKFEG